MEPIVTILIPNYKTLNLTKLCLHLLKQNTDLNKIHIIAIDNHSQDESLDYLRSLDWITLIERAPETDDTPPLSHSRALDLALQNITTPYVLSMHTDTFVKNEKWLDFLLNEINKDSNIAAVGSWKLEQKSWPHRVAKSIERAYQRAWYWFIRKKKHVIQGVGDNYYYLRSHCALYRTRLLHEYQLTFSDENECAGKVMHRKLKERGHDITFIPSSKLIKYLEHANHATTVLNPQLGSLKKSITKGEKRLKKTLEKLQ